MVSHTKRKPRVFEGLASIAWIVIVALVLSVAIPIVVMQQRHSHLLSFDLSSSHRADAIPLPNGKAWENDDLIFEDVSVSAHLPHDHLMNTHLGALWVTREGADISSIRMVYGIESVQGVYDRILELTREWGVSTDGLEKWRTDALSGMLNAAYFLDNHQVPSVDLEIRRTLDSPGSTYVQFELTWPRESSTDPSP
jgi:hypothetical protein